MRDTIHDFFGDSEAFTFKQVTRKQPPNTQQVGIQFVDMEVTHNYTGIKISVPYEASRSQIERYETAMAMFAVTAIILGLDKDTFT